MDFIFENYEMFIKENADEFATPQGAARMIQDEGSFRAYCDALTEGLDENIRESVLSVLNRQRECLLTESANVPTSAFGSGFTVLSFPLLTDIYAEPIIAELANVYPVNAPVVSIPKVTIKSVTKSYDGTTTTETTIPTATQLVRAGTVNVNVAAGTAVNVFTAASLSSDEMKMNRRYTMITSVRVTETDAASNTHVHDINVSLRPDNRNQFVQEITFQDSTGADTVIHITGHVNYDTGDVTVNATFTGGAAGASFVMDYVTLTLRFTPFSTMKGRTKVEIRTDLRDVTIDPNEDFLIDLTEETMQDYKSIFKIDVMRTLSEAIKRQVLLNKDFDLAFFLSAAESDMAANNTALTVDLNDYNTAAGNFRPATPVDILKAVVPRISTLMSLIYKNFNMYPSYAVTGLKTAALLRSLQDMMMNLPGKKGEMGWTGSTAQFMKLRILESPAINDQKIYLSTKAPANSLERATIIDLIYNPLYIVKEVTDGNTRHFVRARTLLEVARTDGLGVVTVENIDPYIS